MNISFKKVKAFPLFSIFLFALLIYFTTNFSLLKRSLFLLKVLAYLPHCSISLFRLLDTYLLPKYICSFVAGFILFAKQKAIAYSILTWLITSATNFLLARRYGKNVLRKFIGEEGGNKNCGDS